MFLLVFVHLRTTMIVINVRERNKTLPTTIMQNEEIKIQRRRHYCGACLQKASQWSMGKGLIAWGADYWCPVLYFWKTLYSYRPESILESMPLVFPYLYRIQLMFPKIFDKPRDSSYLEYYLILWHFPRAFPKHTANRKIRWKSIFWLRSIMLHV